jgi:thiol-disulfide isomerase/thioredoxin
VASNLDQMDDAFAAKLLEQTLPVFQKSEAEDVKSALADANLEGMLRRLTLPGNVMELEGDVLGGGKFDWKSYRGKVVLVDFSATWCGPCVEEAPNVLDMYNKYKDKGFDVVAVSLDRTPQAAQSYVKTNGIKWTTLFPKKEEDRYWNHPMVKHYGVTGIPTAILLDKDGKAVHMNARADKLRDELQRLLGDPAESTAAAPAKESAAG